MPSLLHQAPVELLHRNPALAAVLLARLGVPVPPAATATIVSAEATASVPLQRLADAVVLFTGADGGRLAVVVVEVQLRYDKEKRYSWPVYLAEVRALYRSPAVLLVICTGAATARRCRAEISTGHPGFDLTPLVIDAATVPGPSVPGFAAAAPELVVLAVLTGALDLDEDKVRRTVLVNLAGLDEGRLAAYTVFILNAASASARKALEALMTTTKFRNDFVDRLLAEGEARGEARGKAEGEAEGQARMILRILAARGVEVPADLRHRVLSCADTSQLDDWGDRAATATSLTDVFGA